jgi:hypothetical protein
VSVVCISSLEALEHFDLALERMGDRDLSSTAWLPLRAEGYNGRANAAHCAVAWADREAASSTEKDGIVNDDRSFARVRLPKAIERINTCLAAAPGDTYLHGMLARAEQLLQEAN